MSYDQYIYDLPDFIKTNSCSSKGMRVVAEKQGHPLNVVKAYEFEIPKSNDLSSSDLLLEMILSPIDYADMLNVRGYYGTHLPKYPLIGGNEGVFRVIAIGKDVKHVKTGDIVCPMEQAAGTWASHMVISSEKCQKLSPDIDVLSAATLKVNLCTAYRLLTDFSDLHKGDILVQNGATSHVGQTIIQLCRRYGIRSINIIRTSSELQTIKSLEILGSDAIIKINDQEPPDMNEIFNQLKSFSWFDQNKVVIGLNCIGGVYFDVVEKLLKPGSSLVTYGGILKRSNEISINSLIFRGIKFVGFSMNDWHHNHFNSIKSKHMFDSLSHVINSGSYFRPPFQSFPLSKYKEAFEMFSSRISSPSFSPRLLFTKDISYTQNMVSLCKKLIK